MAGGPGSPEGDRDGAAATGELSPDCPCWDKSGQPDRTTTMVGADDCYLKGNQSALSPPPDGVAE
jgi:hypothetical protein